MSRSFELVWIDDTDYMEAVNSEDASVFMKRGEIVKKGNRLVAKGKLLERMIENAKERAADIWS